MANWLAINKTRIHCVYLRGPAQMLSECLRQAGGGQVGSWMVTQRTASSPDG